MTVQDTCDCKVSPSLSADEEEDSDGREVDDPRGDLHHGLGEAREEVEQRLPALLHHGQGDPQHHCRDEKRC